MLLPNIINFFEPKTDSKVYSVLEITNTPVYFKAKTLKIKLYDDFALSLYKKILLIRFICNFFFLLLIPSIRSFIYSV